MSRLVDFGLSTMLDVIAVHIKILQANDKLHVYVYFHSVLSKAVCLSVCCFCFCLSACLLFVAWIK